MSDPSQGGPTGPAGSGSGDAQADDFAATALDRPAFDFGPGAAKPPHTPPTPASYGAPAPLPIGAPPPIGPSPAGPPIYAPSHVPAPAYGIPPMVQAAHSQFAATSVLPAIDPIGAPPPPLAAGVVVPVPDASPHQPAVYIPPPSMPHLPVVPIAPPADSFAATTVDRPAFDVRAQEPPTGLPIAPPAISAPKLTPAAPAGSDLGLKIALGAIIVVIALITLGIFAAIAVTLASDGAPAGDEASEDAR